MVAPYVPGAHWAAQDTEPLEGAYVARPQGVQVDTPVAEKVPGGQGEGEEGPPRQKKPGGHSVDVRGSGQKKPGAHGATVNLRIRLPLVSATITLPPASTATPIMPPNKASAPVPSAKPNTLPASVLTTPPGVTLRIRMLAPTITLPLASTATPLGSENEAPLPTPLVDVRIPLPASVVTTPPGVTLRIRWFCQSATIMLPLASMATP